MKKVTYRIKFIIESSKDKTETRNDRLTSILSTLEDIDTETPLESPAVNQVIEIDSQEFVVSKKNFTFSNDGDIVFYTTLVYLTKKQEQKKSHDEYIEAFKKLIDDKSKPKSKYGYTDLGDLNDFFGIK